MYIKKEHFTGGIPIIMYDFFTKEPIQEFYNATYASRALFKKSRGNKLFPNLHGRTKKVFLPDKRKVYFKYKEDGENTN